jgi:glycosyltransferase involved in cell wall biosynthesis
MYQNGTTSFISMVIPAFNEVQSIDPLIGAIHSVMDPLSYDFEIIIVNDGSTDTTRERLDAIAGKDELCKVIHLRKNSGQTAAMMAGIDNAKGDVIVTLDADMQNDPADIPALIDKLNEGYDVCSGWRKVRKDNPLLRTLPSKLANLLIKLISNVKLHDYGCTLKAYRKEILSGVRLYGEMHRFIPIYAKWNGAKVAELPVAHHPRRYGKSKYGLRRTVKVLLDLMVIQFMQAYFQKPIYIFGSFGLLSFALSLCTFLGMLYYKYFGNKTFIETPLPQLAVLFFLIGFIAIFMGFIAQVNMMTYYESQDRKPYMIAYTRNLEQ